ncbi:GNAT family N-acetyltransferase [Mongoliitalea lutea]|uniref:N-acetyltransferase domain-containing protein n=1 Tax=Mongoliitalea lutea TaxID=849756 RepID=A0A8J3CV74_9BACT|nr:GNAT family N-acetyltransferase [Mongoliitalea lutea]GHB23722.1 hypothetical protein GCM10008106_00370 [Mongoliitalea lutea]
MLEVRKATDQDLAEIVQVLKASLGDSLMPKSETLWLWKHQQNPFGVSPVLLACENGKIIGVRAFLRWEWMYGSKKYQALRAVDTAVLPTYQGKGIFSKLTKQLIDEVRIDGFDFIFNTPNQYSEPGYLKLGWRKIGSLAVGIKPTWLLGARIGQVESNWEALEGFDFSKFEQTYHWQTVLSKDFLYWRYLHCPVSTYVCLSNGKDFFCIYRIKQLKGLRELRIVELGFTSFGNGEEVFLNQLKHAISTERAHLLTASSLHAKKLQQLGIGRFWVFNGPGLTVKNLTKDFPTELFQLQAWTTALGDMEVF